MVLVCQVHLDVLLFGRRFWWGHLLTDAHSSSLREGKTY